MSLTLRKRPEAVEETDAAPVTPEPAPFAPALAVLPHVNLLPPEIQQRRRFRDLQIGLGGAVVGCVGLVALLYVSATGAVSDAQAEVTASQATGQQLQAEAGKYGDVTAAYTQAEAGKALLTRAMGQEIRFSKLLSGLSTTLPPDVWLGTMTLTQTGATAAPAATTGAAAPAAGSVGTVTFDGTGTSHDSVAAWLDALAGTELYADPTFSKSSEALLAGRKTVTFSSTATLTDRALSHRYTAAGG